MKISVYSHGSFLVVSGPGGHSGRPGPGPIPAPGHRVVQKYWNVRGLSLTAKYNTLFGTSYPKHDSFRVILDNIISLAACSPSNFLFSKSFCVHALQPSNLLQVSSVCLRPSKRAMPCRTSCRTCYAARAMAKQRGEKEREIWLARCVAGLAMSWWKAARYP